jgi:hypothetical protein
VEPDLSKSVCTLRHLTARQAIIDFDPGTQIDVNDGAIDLAPVGWVQTKKRRPRQPFTQCLAGWLTTWMEEDFGRQAKARAEGGEPPSSTLITYRGKKVATTKRAIRRAGTELGLVGFSQYSFRHFMADQVKKSLRGVPREHRSLWMGHVVRDGSRTTDNYESDDPHVLADVALATDCVIALIQEHCDRSLFAIEPLLNRKELERIGARAFPNTRKRQRVNGGRDRDRTCDPYHVKKACGVEAVGNQGTSVAVCGNGGARFRGRSARMVDADQRSLRKTMTASFHSLDGNPLQRAQCCRAGWYTALCDVKQYDLEMFEADS